MTQVSTKDNKKPKATKKTMRSSSTTSKSNKKGGVSGPQRILDFLLAMEDHLKKDDIPRKMVVSMSGVKSTTFPVTISGMKKSGLIEYNASTMSLTDKGRTKANPTSGTVEVFDNATAQSNLKKQFKIGGGMPALLFDALIDGCSHQRTILAEEIGATNKATFAVMLCNMKKNGIIDYDRTTVKLTDLSFPMGRPDGPAVV